MLFDLRSPPSTSQKTIQVALLSKARQFALFKLLEIVVQPRSWAKHINHDSEVQTLQQMAGVALKLKNVISLPEESGI